MIISAVSLSSDVRLTLLKPPFQFFQEVVLIEKPPCYFITTNVKLKYFA